MSDPLETLEVRALRAEINAVKVDFRYQPERQREFQSLVFALIKAEAWENLLEDFKCTSGLDNPTILAIMATGIQIGIDVQKTRTP